MTGKHFPHLPDKEEEHTEYSSAALADMSITDRQITMEIDKFHASQGHGFAAEQVNHLHDILSGRNAAVVGGDNAKDGADRRVDGINIQTKYCRTASASVDAAFRNGQYRYLNPDGSPMQLEVPAEQFEQAVSLVEQKILNGQIPGITDPAEAKSIVRKGHFTYVQARNIAKAGTIDSLVFDSVNGAVICANALGITATITFAKSLWNGQSLDIAIENALCSGLETGGAAFAVSVIAAQLSRLGLNSALVKPTEAIIKAIPKSVRRELMNVLGKDVAKSGAQKYLAKLLRGNIISSTIMMAALSAKDLQHAFEGRISGTQLFKNITTAAGGMAGGVIGDMGGKEIGKFIIKMLPLPPGTKIVTEIIITVGGFAGSVVVGNAGAQTANTVIGTFIEDDAVKMTRIIEDQFCEIINDYALTQEEVDIVLDELSITLSDPEVLLNMYADANHEAFANRLVEAQIEKLMRMRARIMLPTEAELMAGLGKTFEDAANGTGIFAPGYSSNIDPVEIGWQLTGKELAPHVARKAWYQTRQTNLTQLMAEMKLKGLAMDISQMREALTPVYDKQRELENEIQTLLGGQNL